MYRTRNMCVVMREVLSITRATFSSQTVLYVWNINTTGLSRVTAIVFHLKWRVRVILWNINHRFLVTTRFFQMPHRSLLQHTVPVTEAEVNCRSSFVCVNKTNCFVESLSIVVYQEWLFSSSSQGVGGGVTLEDGSSPTIFFLFVFLHTPTIL